MEEDGEGAVRRKPGKYNSVFDPFLGAPRLVVPADASELPFYKPLTSADISRTAPFTCGEGICTGWSVAALQ